MSLPAHAADFHLNKLKETENSQETDILVKENNYKSSSTRVVSWRRFAGFQQFS